MRSFRAFLASLGAGTCLVLAGTLAMATLSTVVAFSGLPGLSASAPGTSAAVLVAMSPAGTGTPVEAEPLALAPMRSVRSSAVARPAARAASPAPRVRPPARDAESVPAAPDVTTPTPAATPAAPAATTPPAASGVPGPPVGEPVREAGRALGGTVTDTGDGLAEVVAPVLPDLATGVRDTTDLAGGTVAAATEAVDDLLDGLAGTR